MASVSDISQRHPQRQRVQQIRDVLEQWERGELGVPEDMALVWTDGVDTYVVKDADDLVFLGLLEAAKMAAMAGEE